MNLQQKFLNITVKQMDMEKAAINWGHTMLQEKVKQQWQSNFTLFMHLGQIIFVIEMFI